MKRLPPYGKKPRKKVLKPPQRDLNPTGNGGAREGAGRPPEEPDERLIRLMAFCKAQGWPLSAIGAAVDLSKATVHRRLSVSPQEAHRGVQTILVERMWQIAMNDRDPRMFKALSWLANRFIPDFIPCPVEIKDEPGVTVMVDVEEVKAEIMRSAAGPQEVRTLANVFTRMEGGGG